MLPTDQLYKVMIAIVFIAVSAIVAIAVFRPSGENNMEIMMLIVGIVSPLLMGLNGKIAADVKTLVKETKTLASEAKIETIAAKEEATAAKIQAAEIKVVVEETKSKTEETKALVVEAKVKTEEGQIQAQDARTVINGQWEQFKHDLLEKVRQEMFKQLAEGREKDIKAGIEVGIAAFIARQKLEKASS